MEKFYKIKFVILIILLILINSSELVFANYKITKLVPIRELFEKLNYNVSWLVEEQKIKIENS